MKRLLALGVMSVMILAMGMIAYGQEYRDVANFKAGDILKDGEKFTAGSLCGVVGEGIESNGYDGAIYKNVYTMSGTRKIAEIVRQDGNTGGEYTYTITWVAGWKPETGSTPQEEEEDSEARRKREEERRKEAWEKSDSNPDNYLPKVTVADGKELQSTIPSHYADNRKDSSISTVFSTTPEQEFNAALGLPAGSYAHMNAYASQCGPSLWAAFKDYADAIGAQLSNDITIGDVFELQMEVRDKDSYKLLNTVKESKVPVNLVIALKGDVLEQVKAGKDSAALCYADGEITLIKDVDDEKSTVTMSTTKTTGIFAVVYAPAGTFDTLP